jgi:hypothetical protein
LVTGAPANPPRLARTTNDLTQTGSYTSLSKRFFARDAIQFIQSINIQNITIAALD